MERETRVRAILSHGISACKIFRDPLAGEKLAASLERESEKRGERVRDKSAPLRQQLPAQRSIPAGEITTRAITEGHQKWSLC